MMFTQGKKQCQNFFPLSFKPNFKTPRRDSSAADHCSCAQGLEQQKRNDVTQLCACE